MSRRFPAALFTIAAATFALISTAAFADGNLNKVNHIIVVMQENRSFDNYFGALAYAPGSPYHNGNGVCASTDHKCVDGLTCTVNAGTLSCTNLTSTTTDPLSSRLKPRLVVSFPTSIIPGLALTARSTSRIRIVH